MAMTDPIADLLTRIRNAHRVSKRQVAVPYSKLKSRAVSYTHLRAHETVLDLVCRLLLEKKNKTQKNPNYFPSKSEVQNTHHT